METNQLTALVFDHGIFEEFAIRLGKEYKRVLYHCPWEYGFSHVNDAMVGQGMDNIEWCDDPLDPEIIKEVDLYCFPDVQHSGMQLLLESLGKPVWGSRKADHLELEREKFKKLQKELGMAVPEYKNLKGMSKLMDYLKENEDVYIKISRYRGSMETFHHVSMELSDDWLDQKRIEFGGMKEHIPFVVEHKIKAKAEIGGDMYCIDGRFPSICIHGPEVKDQSYIGAVKPYEELPEEVREANEFLAPVLKKYRYRNWWSMEMRKNYLIDPTCRQPSPAGESEMELYGNLGEIVWAGAHGELIDPEPTAKFAVQCLLEHNGDEACWRTLDIPDKVRDRVKLRYACKIDGMYKLVPQPEPHDPSIGWVMGTGDTIQEAIDDCMEAAEALEGQHLTVHTETLADALKAVEAEEKMGIDFAEEIPEPATIIEG